MCLVLKMILKFYSKDSVILSVILHRPELLESDEMNVMPFEVTLCLFLLIPYPRQHDGSKHLR
jgi:hypothetical protein